MDPHLQKYLAQPAPRPAMQDARYAESAVLWQFPVGAAFTGGVILAGVVGTRRDWLLPGLIAWTVFVAAALVAARILTGSRQSLFRSGIFADARVLEHERRNDGEDEWLELVLGVDLDQRTGEYREAPGRRDARYRLALSHRWFEAGTERFQPGAVFPILVSSTRSTALVFIDDEALDAAVARERE